MGHVLCLIQDWKGDIEPPAGGPSLVCWGILSSIRVFLSYTGPLLVSTPVKRMSYKSHSDDVSSTNEQKVYNGQIWNAIVFKGLELQTV